MWPKSALKVSAVPVVALPESSLLFRSEPSVSGSECHVCWKKICIFPERGLGHSVLGSEDGE